MEETNASLGDRRRKRKRDIYTPRACDGCKLRKIKCSGNTPCSRCTDSHTTCTYTSRSVIENNRLNNDAPSQTSQTVQGDRLSELERFVQVVQDGLAQLKPCILVGPSFPSNPSTRRHCPRRTSAAPRPSTANFENMIELALSSLAANGITPETDQQVVDVKKASDEHDNDNDLEDNGSPAGSNSQAILIQAGKFITSLMDETTAHKLLDTFASDVWSMYPCVEMKPIRQNLTTIYTLTSGVLLPDRMRQTYVSDIEILKAVLMVAATCTENSEPSLVASLESSLIWSVDSCFTQDGVGPEDLVMACLMCLSFVAQDKRQKAWRIAGFAARIALELGLDLTESASTGDSVIFKPPLPCIPNGSVLFACIYDLDLRSSLMVELPRALPDKLRSDHFDSLLPSHHLRNMLEMDRLADEIQALAKACMPGEEIAPEKAGYLEYRLVSVQQTYNKAVEDNASPCLCTPYPILRVFSDLRANTIRCLLYRRGLLSAQKAVRQSDSIEKLIRAAEENVWLSKEVMERTSLPTLLQHTFHHFLMTAIACIFLAVTYRPGTYRSRCQSAFLAGLQILEALPHKVRGSDFRRQYSMANLRRLATRVFIRTEEEETEHNSALRKGENDVPSAVVGQKDAVSHDTVLPALSIPISHSAPVSLETDDEMTTTTSRVDSTSSTDDTSNVRLEPVWPALEFDYQPLAMWNMMWDQRSWLDSYNTL